MAEKLRLFAIVSVFLVFGAVLFAALSKGNEISDPVNSADAPDFSRQPASAPEFDFDPAPGTSAPEETDPGEDTVHEDIPANADLDDDSPATGNGKITVTLEMQGNLNVPGNTLVTLHYIPEEAQFDSTADTVYAESNPNAENKVVFENLPMGYFVVFAQSAMHTGTSNRSLSPEYHDREVTVELYPVGYISGSVVNTNGEPVLDAKVFVAGYLSGGRDLDAGLYRSRASGVPVDETGAYTMNNLQVRVPALEYRLMAMAPGYAPKITELYPLGSTGVQIVLGAGGRVAGMVVNEETGDPVSNVELGALPLHDLAQKKTDTDEEGRFEFAELAPGDYTFAVKSEELVVKGESLKLEVFDGQDVDDMRIAVMPGGIATGRVYDSDTGAGVSGAEINAYPSDIPGASSKETKTDANGEYRFVGLHAGPYQIRYRQIDGYPEMDWQDRKEVVATLGQALKGLDFPLSKGLSVSGVIVSENGKPVESGHAYGNSYRANRSDSTQISERGAFALYGYEAGDEVRLQITPNGFGRIYETVTLEDESVTGLRLVAEQEAKISGIVVNRAGTPLNNISIYARNNTDNIMGGGNESNAQGEFEIDRLSSGEYTLRQSRGDMYSSADKVLETVTLAKGEHKENVRVVVEEDDDSMTISGVVTDDLGEPVQGANVQSYSGRSNARTQTGPRGRYTLTGLAAGTTVRVQFNHEQHVPQNESFEAGTKDANMVLPRVGLVSGRVLDASTREPVPGFQILVVPGQYQSHMEQNFRTYYHENGEFSVTGTHPGTENSLRVRSTGYADTRVPIQGAQSGQTISGITVELRDESRLTGTVRDESGAPVSAAWIFIGPLPRNEWERDRLRKATTDGSGQFELGGLGAGDATFTAFKNGLAPDMVAAYIGNGTTNIDFVLGAGATIEGEVTLHGDPAEGGQIYGTIFDGQGQDRMSFDVQGSVDDDGRYRISGLPNGRGSVGASVQDGSERRSKRLEVEVAAGQVTEANFHFEAATSAVEGYIFKSENETGAGRVSLELMLPDGTRENRYKEVGADGYYIFESLPAGDVSIRVYDQQTQRQKRASGVVGPNETLRLDLNLYGGGDVAVNAANIPAGHAGFAALVAPNFPIPSTLTEQFFQDMAPYVEAQTQIANGAGTIVGASAGNYNLIVVHYRIDQSAGSVDFSTAGIASTPVSVTDGEQVTAQVSF